MSQTSTHFASQTGSTPTEAQESSSESEQLSEMSVPPPDATPAPPLNPRVVVTRPIFTPTNEETPARPELAIHAAQVDAYITSIEFTLNFLGIPQILWPTHPDMTIAAGRVEPVTSFRLVARWGDAMSAFERTLADHSLNVARQETATARAQSLGTTTASGAGPRRFKTPMPSKYGGKKGDEAFTFLAACNNYRFMEPGAFVNDEVCVRWALQQMEDKAGQWAVRQLIRMEQELDLRDRPPKELRKWDQFGKFFITQFGDPGLIDQAKAKWKAGLSQNGKAVDYFEQVEAIILRLNYPRDAQIVLDQVVMGLKDHIRIHFIGTEWATLNEMKEKIIPFDAAYFEINRKPGEKKIYTNQTKNTPQNQTSNANQGQQNQRNNNPLIKTETAKTGTRRYLPPDEFEYCRKNRLCFICKGNGFEIVGSAKFHPNHLPQSKIKEPQKKMGVAAVEELERGTNEKLGEQTEDNQSKN
jgi:hypothetical protein